MRQTVLALIAAVALTASFDTARADWSYTPLHPSGYWYSTARAISGGQIGGFAASMDQARHPGYWTNGDGAWSFADLYDNMPGEVLAVGGGMQEWIYR